MTPEEMGYDGGDDNGFSWGRYFAAHALTILALGVTGAAVGAATGGIYGMLTKVESIRDTLGSFIVFTTCVSAVGGAAVGLLAGIPVGIYFGKGHTVSFD